MQVYLDECQVGEGTQINFPHLLLCMGVTCQMSDGWLIGCHIMGGGQNEECLLAEMNNRIVGYSRTHFQRPVNLYAIGNIGQHCHTYGGKPPYEKAHTLKFKGNLWVYNTVVMKVDDGHFARIESKPDAVNQPCNVWVCADRTVRPYKLYAKCGIPDDRYLKIVEAEYDLRTMDIKGFRVPSKTPLKNGISGILPPPLNRSDFKLVGDYQFV